MLTGFLVVSITSLGVLVVGTVVPHLFARAGHQEAVDTGWLVLATAVAFLTALAASLLATRRLVAPMAAVLATARAFAGGDHAARVPELGRPELTELVDALNAAASEVERSEQERQHHTADIAHELRTPLAVLQGGLEELRDGLAQPTPATLATLHDQATRLGRVVNDLAELSAVESAGLQLELERIDLGAVSDEALQARTRAMSDAGLSWRGELCSGVTVLADRDRLHQILGNLLANATGYCRPGDEVIVRVRARGDQGVLEVADTGPGLTDEERARAFDRSWRGPSTRGTPGSGLGLTIVRALVLAEGGQVTLSSEAGRGTVVRVALPLAR